MDLNRTMLIGNVTRDPELRTTPTGQTVCSFGLATNRMWKDRQTGERKQSVEFHNIVAWSGLAQTIGQFVKKGSRLYIDGRLQTRTWDDPAGQKRNRTEITAENMILLDRPGASANRPAPDTTATTPDAPAAAPDDTEINVEEIPF